MTDPKAFDRSSSKTDETIAPERLTSLRPDEDTLITLAKHVRYARMRHSASFPKEVFRDSAWDMMLELFVQAGEGNRSIGVKQLTLHSGETPTSAIRRIDRLQEAGLIRRRPDLNDQRRVYIELTAGGHAAMTGFLRDILSMMPLDMATAESPASPVTFRPQEPRD